VWVSLCERGPESPDASKRLEETSLRSITIDQIILGFNKIIGNWGHQAIINSSFTSIITYKSVET
jgi:hypothetical protein